LDYAFDDADWDEEGVVFPGLEVVGVLFDAAYPAVLLRLMLSAFDIAILFKERMKISMITVEPSIFLLSTKLIGGL